MGLLKFLICCKKVKDIKINCDADYVLRLEPVLGSSLSPGLIPCVCLQGELSALVKAKEFLNIQFEKFQGMRKNQTRNLKNFQKLVKKLLILRNFD